MCCPLETRRVRQGLLPSCSVPSLMCLHPHKAVSLTGGPYASHLPTSLRSALQLRQPIHATPEPLRVPGLRQQGQQL